MQQWYVWQQEEKRKDEKKRLEEKRHKLVGRVMSSAEGGARFVYRKGGKKGW